MMHEPAVKLPSRQANMIRDTQARNAMTAYSKDAHPSLSMACCLDGGKRGENAGLPAFSTPNGTVTTHASAVRARPQAVSTVTPLAP
jgi:hypothetical protein